MINKFKVLLGVVWLFTVSVANAQSSTPNATVNGSPYLDDKYVEGVIYYATKNHTAQVRYNAFQDLIEFLQNGKAMVLDPNETIKKITLGATTFVPAKYEANGKPKLGYFELLDSGKVTLYSKKKIIFLDVKKGGALDGSDKPAEFKRTPDEFYVKVGDGLLQEVGNLKSLIASFPDKQEELTQYAKKEKISTRKAKEIIQFIQYYNSL